MWLRNVVCSVVTIAGVWALTHYWREVGEALGADHDLSGTAIFGALSLLVILGMYLIARTVDARAARQRGQTD